MAKKIKNTLGNFLLLCLIFVIVSAWLFSGWPQVWKNPPIPPRIQEAWADTLEFTVTGPWVAPAGITSVDVECWGAGGAGGGTNTTPDGGGGGGGGGYSKTVGVAVTPSTEYTVTVGIKGTGVSGANGNPGGESSFNGDSESVIAKGGQGGKAPVGGAGGVAGAGGQASAGTGNTKWSGGSGGTGCDCPFGAGAGGGGGAGNAADGGIGGSSSNKTVGTGGAGGTSGGGGGGTGGYSANGNPGTAPGGAGGGSGNGTFTGGNGADGKCILTWGIVSIYVKDGTIDYGYVPLSEGACSTTTSDTQRAINNGSASENFNIKSTDTTNWDIGTSSPGSEIYTHLFTTTTGDYWQYIDNEYVTLENGVIADGTSTIDTYIFVPSSTSNYGVQSTTITIQAVVP